MMMKMISLQHNYKSMELKLAVKVDQVQLTNNTSQKGIYKLMFLKVKTDTMKIAKVKLKLTMDSIKVKTNLTIVRVPSREVLSLRCLKESEIKKQKVKNTKKPKLRNCHRTTLLILMTRSKTSNRF